MGTNDEKVKQPWHSVVFKREADEADPLIDERPIRGQDVLKSLGAKSSAAPDPTSQLIRATLFPRDADPTVEEMRAERLRKTKKCSSTTERIALVHKMFVERFGVNDEVKERLTEFFTKDLPADLKAAMEKK